MNRPNHDDISITGVILAGGRSRRFGADKALHQLAGQSMIEQVYDKIIQVASPIFISTGASSKSYPLPVRHLADDYPGAGPLAGLHAGLTSTSADWVLFVAVDMPFVRIASLHRLIAATSNSCEAVIAKGKDRLHPLLGCYKKTLAPKMEVKILNRQLKVTSFLDDVRTNTLVVPEAELININRLTDIP